MTRYGRPTVIVTTRLSAKSLGAGRPPPDSVQKGTVMQSLSKRARRRIKTVIRARGLVRDDL